MVEEPGYFAVKKSVIAEAVRTVFGPSTVSKRSSSASMIVTPS